MTNSMRAGLAVTIAIGIIHGFCGYVRLAVLGDDQGELLR